MVPNLQFLRRSSVDEHLEGNEAIEVPRGVVVPGVGGTEMSSSFMLIGLSGVLVGFVANGSVCSRIAGYLARV